MSHRLLTCRTEIARLSIVSVVVLAVVALVAWQPGQLAAQPPTMELTEIGSPIWRPVDFELFSAPIEPDEAFLATVDAVLGTTYTAHAPPYDHELSNNVAVAGFVSRSIFPREAITADPNGIFFPILLLPDPGIIGESRDFASGPIIPNSLFPMTSRAEVWQNDQFQIVLDGGSPLPVRPEDAPFEGTSHRIRIGNMWNRGSDPLGNYEIRWSLRDTQGNGWDMAFPFQVVDELPTLSGDFNQNGVVDAADYVVWRKTDGTQSGYDAWRANFGASLSVGSSSAAHSLGSSAEPLSTVPEPSALLIILIAAIGLQCVSRPKRMPLCRTGAQNG
jgi:hypothetical protein